MQASHGLFESLFEIQDLRTSVNADTLASAVPLSNNVLCLWPKRLIASTMSNHGSRSSSHEAMGSKPLCLQIKQNFIPFSSSCHDKPQYIFLITQTDLKA